jgi:predicted metal-binding membrane protein
VKGALTTAARRPTLWVESGVVLVWALLILGSVLSTGSASASGSGWSSGPLWLCVTGMAKMGSGVSGHAEHLVLAGPSTSLVATMPMLALMAVAMMVPPALPAIGYVGLNSLYWRRRRAVLEFVVVFLAVWVAYSVVVLGAIGSSGVTSSPLAAAAALALAALWQLTPAKRRALQACHRTRPLPPKGWRATVGVADFGLNNGAACLASCWAMMLTTAFVGLPKLAWMAALTALITAERLSLKPRRASRRIGIALGAAAIVAAALALL